MKIEELIKEAFSVFKRPILIIVLTAYGTLYQYLSKVNPTALLPFSFLLKPIIYSYIISYFFIEAVEPQRINEHKRIAFLYYFPFLKIGIIYLAIAILFSVILAIFIPFAKDNQLLTNLFSGFIYAFYPFWITSCVFEKNKIWGSLKKSLKIIGSYPMFYLIIFIILFLDTAFFRGKTELFRLTGQNFLIVLAFIFLSSICYLIFYKIIVLINVSRENITDHQNLLIEYLSSKDVSLGLPHDEKIEIRAANKCLILGLLSFIPSVHLFAVYFGMKRFLKQKFGRVRSISGFIFGSFFTLMYLLMLVGTVTHPKGGKLVHARTIEKYLTADTTSKELKGALRDIKDAKYYQAIDILKGINTTETEAKYFALGLAYEKTKYTKEAIDMFKKCSELEGHNGEAFFHLGVLNLYAPDKMQDARNYFNKFLKIFPSDAETLRFIELIENRVDWENNIIIKIFIMIIILISFTLHEFAHAYTAYKCGDTTQKASGRVTLNPIPHLDLFGSIILPGLLILRNSSVVFGWAKPVALNRDNFKNPERDETLVSLMGPSTNLLVGLTATLLLTFVGLLLSRTFPNLKTLNYFSPFAVTSCSGIPFAKFWIYVNMFLMELVIISIVLAIFNLLPIPPLDGSWLFPKMLPQNWRLKYEAVRKYSLIFIIILIFTGVLNFVIELPLGLYFAFLNYAVAPALGLG